MIFNGLGGWGKVGSPGAYDSRNEIDNLKQHREQSLQRSTPNRVHRVALESSKAMISDDVRARREGAPA